MKRGMPERQELVVCRVTKLYPNSVFADLLEYDKSGMIHVSEVAGRWVRDIREFVKEKQYIVCRVMRVEGSEISLSIKRVRRDDGSRKLNEFKRERRAENLLEQVAKSLKKTKKQAFEEVGFSLQEEFGSLTKSFEFAVKNPELLKKKGIPAKWAQAIIEVARKKFGEKTYQVKVNVDLSCFKPDGVEVIKKMLGTTRRKGFSVAYVSAPRYQLMGTGKDFKKLRASLEEESESLVRAIQKEGGEGKFTLKE